MPSRATERGRAQRKRPGSGARHEASAPKHTANRDIPAQWIEVGLRTRLQHSLKAKPKSRRSRCK
eukprot:10944529-Alexandrium_andersonii.AAC.1